jgi:transcriptional regulator with XRE-family HTH domain
MPSPDFYQAVGRLIRQARDNVGLTQETLAARVSLTRTSVTNIEKGRQKLLLHTFCQFAEALAVSPAALLPSPAVAANETPIDELLKGRPKNEREWIKSAITLTTKDR